jgi:hypothetical protein
LGWFDGLDRVDVEFRKAFESREFRIGDAAGASPFRTGVDFGGQQFGQKHQIGLAFAGSDLR